MIFVKESDMAEILRQQRRLCYAIFMNTQDPNDIINCKEPQYRKYRFISEKEGTPPLSETDDGTLDNLMDMFGMKK